MKRKSLLLAVAFLLMASVVGAEDVYLVTWEREIISLGSTKSLGIEEFKTTDAALEHINKYSGVLSHAWKLYRATEVSLTKTEGVPAVPEKYYIESKYDTGDGPRYLPLSFPIKDGDRSVDLEHESVLSEPTWHCLVGGGITISCHAKGPYCPDAEWVLVKHDRDKCQRSFHVKQQLTRANQEAVRAIQGIAYVLRYKNNYELEVTVADLFIDDWPRIQGEIFKVLCR